MKHIGTHSLLAGCLMLVLMDAAPIPQKLSCKDKRERKRHEQYMNNLPEIVIPDIITGDVIDKGTTWATISGSLKYDTSGFEYQIQDFGIKYRLNDGQQSDFIKISASGQQYESFKVELKNLQPGLPYQYFTYVTIDSTVFSGKIRIFETRIKD